MEVFLQISFVIAYLSCLLHVRGGVSKALNTDSALFLSSPRPWRCFCPLLLGSLPARVFSTSVEVFPWLSPFSLVCRGLLHVRGGVSVISGASSVPERSSPRPWRCFRNQRCFVRTRTVFSTSVEVFLVDPPKMELERRLLHVRGGVSGYFSSRYFTILSSPRPWRCFSCRERVPTRDRVFSTSVEVFPRLSRPRSWTASLLHVRGGVSAQMMEFNAQQRSSPRPWRCFLQHAEHGGKREVFSTSVEVFPTRSTGSPKTTCLLHVRGGVSAHAHDSRTRTQSSPRPWRCFLPEVRQL